MVVSKFGIKYKMWKISLEHQIMWASKEAVQEADVKSTQKPTWRGCTGQMQDNLNIKQMQWIRTYKIDLNLWVYGGAQKILVTGPWLVWLSGLNAGLETKGSLVQFPVRAHAWVAGQVPSRGCMRGNHTLMFLSPSFSLTSPLSKNK